MLELGLLAGQALLQLLAAGMELRQPLLQPCPGNRFGGLTQVGQFPFQSLPLSLDRFGLIAAAQLELLLQLLELRSAELLLLQRLGERLAAARGDLNAHPCPNIEFRCGFQAAPFTTGQQLSVERDRLIGSQHLQPGGHRFASGGGLG